MTKIRSLWTVSHFPIFPFFFFVSNVGKYGGCTGLGWWGYLNHSFLTPILSWLLDWLWVVHELRWWWSKFSLFWSWKSVVHISSLTDTLSVRVRIIRVVLSFILIVCYFAKWISASIHSVTSNIMKLILWSLKTTVVDIVDGYCYQHQLSCWHIFYDILFWSGKKST